MNLTDLRNALRTSEEIEYHLMGMEQGASLIGGAGWYPCIVTGIYKNGNVEISFTSLEEDRDDLGATVLSKNIPLAFRRKVVTE